MNPIKSGNSRSAIISAAAAHVLAWAAFLGIAFWPYMYLGASETPVNPGEAAETARETVRQSASFIEVNGVVVLIPMFVPVLFTGLALFLVLNEGGWRVGRAVILWLLAVSLLAFCFLGAWSFGVIYLPAALASIVAATVCTLRRQS